MSSAVVIFIFLTLYFSSTIQAGYGRHRTTYVRSGAEGLEEELDLDCTRLWERNLGRYEKYKKKLKIFF